MTNEEHRKFHIKLHDYLDLLVYDMISCTGMLPSKTTVAELMDWSYEQTREVEKTRSMLSDKFNVGAALKAIKKSSA